MCVIVFIFVLHITGVTPGQLEPPAAPPHLQRMDRVGRAVSDGEEVLPNGGDRTAVCGIISEDNRRFSGTSHHQNVQL